MDLKENMCCDLRIKKSFGKGKYIYLLGLMGAPTDLEWNRCWETITIFTTITIALSALIN